MDGRMCVAPTCEDEMTYRLDPAFTTEERKSIHDAMRVWERGTGGRVCFLPTEAPMFRLAIIRADDPIVLRPVDPLWEKHAGLYRNGVIWIVAKEGNQRVITDIATHELGHALGLKHSDQRQSIMRGNEGAREWNGELSANDRAQYCGFYRCACR